MQTVDRRPVARHAPGVSSARPRRERVGAAALLGEALRLEEAVVKRSTAPLAGVVLAVLSVLSAPPVQAAEPYCGIRWGSQPRDLMTGSTGEVVDVRAGRHACFDRLVLDVSGDVAGHFVRYVDQVRRDGSGAIVPLRGGARLEVIATAPVAPTDAWFLAGGELVDTRGYRTFRQVAWAGSFEGQTTVGLGVRARLPFRVFLLPGPGAGYRLVVDVAHRW